MNSSVPALATLWDEPAPFTLETMVKPEDIDGLNHTNNTVYVKWCEQVAWAHSVSLGLDLDSYRAVNRAMAITHSEYDYLQASHEGDPIAVATWITHWDKKLTMHRRFQVIRPSDGVTLLRAGMRFVCIDLASGRPRRMPKEFITGYGPAVISEQD
ncbi:MAG: acyl-CoA thioesterase [Halioglobus sp.]